MIKRKFIVRWPTSEISSIEVTTETPEIFGAFVQATFTVSKFDDVSSRAGFQKAFHTACINACEAGLGDYTKLP
jgi:hypothetical protein